MSAWVFSQKPVVPNGYWINERRLAKNMVSCSFIGWKDMVSPCFIMIGQFSKVFLTNVLYSLGKVLLDYCKTVRLTYQP